MNFQFGRRSILQSCNLAMAHRFDAMQFGSPRNRFRDQIPWSSLGLQIPARPQHHPAARAPCHRSSGHCRCVGRGGSSGGAQATEAAGADEGPVLDLKRRLKKPIELLLGANLLGARKEMHVFGFWRGFGLVLWQGPRVGAQ